MGFKMKGPDSMGFLNMNRNKRSIAINLKSEAGKAILFKLVKEADILVENYRPGVMKRLGVGYEVMSKINPALVYVSISGFGQSGPWAMRPGFDLMAQAMSGIMSVTGNGDGKPVKAGVPVADIGCALFATYAALSAYIGAKNTGQGQYIDASLFDSALAFSIWDTSEYWGTGNPPVALGTANRMTAPYQAVKAKDGYFVMGATNNKLWQLLCGILERQPYCQTGLVSPSQDQCILQNRSVLHKEPLQMVLPARLLRRLQKLLERCGFGRRSPKRFRCPQQSSALISGWHHAESNTRPKFLGSSCEAFP